ncbi:MAG: type II toxin-antitoxin system PemK/MazF family toxin [Sphingobacteriaceae bacterium]|nr:type II toxin-antitoxin system PemK/MazF family toxin [Sphingobacteriaceae bacterium]
MKSNIEIKQYDIWVADLNPGKGTETGKIRPVLIIQTNLLNLNGHSSFIICPISSQEREGVEILRLPIEADSENGLQKTSYILADQIRAIDISRLKERVGKISKKDSENLRNSLRVILNLS